MFENIAKNELVGLGLKPMEADVYTMLLQQSPQTGYQIAKQLGKPAAYVYRSIESLYTKGAILIDDGKSRLCRAVPYKEFLDQLQRIFLEKCSLAEDKLSNLENSSEDDRIYNLNTVDQVLERCRNMLDSSVEKAFLDIYPFPYSKLKSNIKAAHERGVMVAMQTYEEIDLEVKYKTITPERKRIQEWPRQWLRVVTDAREYLLALLNKDGSGIYQAVWSASPMLSYLQYYSIGSDIHLSILQNMIESTDSIDELKDFETQWYQFFRNHSPQARIDLEKRFGWK